MMDNVTFLSETLKKNKTDPIEKIQIDPLMETRDDEFCV